MESKNITYVGFYGTRDKKGGRSGALSAMTKMDYVSQVLTELDYDVNIISPSWLTPRVEKSNKFESGSTKSIAPSVSLTFFSSWMSKNKFIRALRVPYSLFCLCFWLMFKVRREDTVICYHAPFLFWPVFLAKKIKKFNLILEVEELYHKVWTIKPRHEIWEKKLISLADSFIAVSELLAEHLPADKEKVILYGSYQLLPPPVVEDIIDNDNKIKVVYAGVIDEIKGGAFKLIEATKYLPDNYSVYILGYGNHMMLGHAKNLIEKYHLSEKCHYIGALHGTVLSDFLLSCDIGVNPQNTGCYMETALPSKVLTYLAHHLKVVSSEVASLQSSKLADKIKFSFSDSPVDIASMIKSMPDVKRNKSNTELIQSLHQNFAGQLKTLI